MFLLKINSTNIPEFYCPGISTTASTSSGFTDLKKYMELVGFKTYNSAGTAQTSIDTSNGYIRLTDFMSQGILGDVYKTDLQADFKKYYQLSNGSKSFYGALKDLYFNNTSFVGYIKIANYTHNRITDSNNKTTLFVLPGTTCLFKQLCTINGGIKRDERYSYSNPNSYPESTIGPLRIYRTTSQLYITDTNNSSRNKIYTTGSFRDGVIPLYLILRINGAGGNGGGNGSLASGAGGGGGAAGFLLIYIGDTSSTNYIEVTLGHKFYSFNNVDGHAGGASSIKYNGSNLISCGGGSGGTVGNKSTGGSAGTLTKDITDSVSYYLFNIKGGDDEVGMGFNGNAAASGSGGQLRKMSSMHLCAPDITYRDDEVDTYSYRFKDCFISLDATYQGASSDYGGGGGASILSSGANSISNASSSINYPNDGLGAGGGGCDYFSFGVGKGVPGGPSNLTIYY